jgi:putative NIF3 family GTP cyclohydrolase 1 type 2
MLVSEVMDHFREIGEWVDWSDTNDVVLHGSEDAEVSGIAVGWIASERAVREAADRGGDLFVSHEGLYLDHPHVPDRMREVLERRCALYDELGMTVVRCHDTWDRMPEIGIPSAWATWLGFDTESHNAVETDLGARRAYYEVCLTGGMALESVALLVAESCRELGQSNVFAVGEGIRFIDRLVVGTGAITRLDEMMQLEPDAIVVTDDGNSWTRDVLYAQAMDVPLIWVTHPVSELPGMMRLADYLADQFPEVPVRYQRIDYPRTVSAR